MLKRLLPCIILACQLDLCLAQSDNVIHYPVRSGLPAGYILHMEEDRYGFMWIATNRGLSKFDGYNFKNYTSQLRDSTAMSGVASTSILDSELIV